MTFPPPRPRPAPIRPLPHGVAQPDPERARRRTLDAYAAYPITRALVVEARAENLFDETVEAGISSGTIVERATPRTLWIGLRYAMR